MNKPEDLIEFVEDKPGHDLRYSLSSDKIRNQMKWKEKTSFEEGIKTTVEWYLSNKEFFYNNLDTSQKTPWK